MSTFDEAFQFVIGVEGGYSDDPNDPGHETRFGISKRAYPNLDIKQLTLEQAKQIYYRDYWVPAGCNALIPSMALLVFDCAVNMGISRAREIFETQKQPVPFQAERAVHYANLPTFKTYGRGWMRRLFNGLLKAQEMK
jgi:lysozyme family protein